MFSCLHCEVTSTNRNSYNRHLRSHLATDVQFLRQKMEDNEVPDVTMGTHEDTLEEEMDTEDVPEDITSILSRYKHIDDTNAMTETARSDIDEASISQKEVPVVNETEGLKDIKSETFSNENVKETSSSKI